MMGAAAAARMILDHASPGVRAVADLVMALPSSDVGSPPPPPWAGPLLERAGAEAGVPVYLLSALGSLTTWDPDYVQEDAARVGLLYAPAVAVEGGRTGRAPLARLASRDAAAAREVLAGAVAAARHLARSIDAAGGDVAGGIVGYLATPGEPRDRAAEDRVLGAALVHVARQASEAAGT